MRKYIYIFQCLLLFCLASHINIHVHAKNDAVYVAPAVWEVRMQPGGSYRLVYKLKSTQKDAVVIPQLVSFTRSAQNTIVYEKANPAMRIELEGEEWGKPMTVGLRHELAIVLHSEGDLKAQDLYYALLLDTQYDAAEPGAITISSSKRTVLPIYLSVLGASHKLSGQLEQWSIDAPISFSWAGRNYFLVDSFSPIPLRLTASNTGNHYFQTSGRIAINGPTQHSYLLEPKRILAHENMLLRAQNDACQPAVKCEPQQSTLVLKGSYLGMYEARAEVKMGVGNEYRTKSLTFLAFPLKHGAILLLLIVVGVVYKYRLGRRSGQALTRRLRRMP